MKSDNDDYFIREVAVALLARDALAGHDCFKVESAVDWARRLLDVAESAEHGGDCTKQPYTCHRCVADEALREAREIHDQ